MFGHRIGAALSRAKAAVSQALSKTKQKVREHAEEIAYAVDSTLIGAKPKTFYYGGFRRPDHHGAGPARGGKNRGKSARAKARVASRNRRRKAFAVLAICFIAAGSLTGCSIDTTNDMPLKNGVPESYPRYDVRCEAAGQVFQYSNVRFNNTQNESWVFQYGGEKARQDVIARFTGLHSCAAIRINLPA
jgi:hypothetical protein